MARLAYLTKRVLKTRLKDKTYIWDLGKHKIQFKVFNISCSCVLEDIIYNVQKIKKAIINTKPKSCLSQYILIELDQLSISTGGHMCSNFL